MNFSIEQSQIGNFIILILKFARSSIQTAVMNPTILQSALQAKPVSHSLFSFQRSNFIGHRRIPYRRQLLYYNMSGCFMQAFLKTFFEVMLASNSWIVVLHIAAIPSTMFSWPELEYTMYRNIMQHLLKKIIHFTFRSPKPCC